MWKLSRSSDTSRQQASVLRDVRRLHPHGPQVRVPVQRELRGPPFLLREEELGDGIPLKRPHAQPSFHSAAKSWQRMFFKQPQHPDVLPGAFTVLVFGLQPAT